MKTRILLLMLAASRLHAGAADPLALPAAAVGAFAAQPVAKAAPAAPAFAETPAKLKDATNGAAVLAMLGVTLTPAEQAYLDEHRFLLVPKARTRYKGQVSLPESAPFHWDEMTGMFDTITGAYDPTQRKPENTKLVTPDIALHTFHKLAENALEQVEITELGATLRRFVSGLRARLLTAGKAAGGAASARLGSLGARMLVPEVILETAQWAPPNPSEAGPDKPVPADDGDTLAAAQKKLDAFKAELAADDYKKASAELELIFAAEKTTPSPFFAEYAKTPVAADYTQFKPRSHYAKKSALRAYFRAMMYLGRNSWAFETDQGLGDALLLMWAMAGPGADKPLLDDWKRVMEVTGFFAGQADDVAYPNLRDFAVKVLGEVPLAPATALAPETLAKLRAKLGELAPPRILSDAITLPGIASVTKDELLARTLGYRVFGQRFTLDGWLLGRLAAGQEKTDLRLPGVPSVAALSAAFGDPAARAVAGALLAQESPPFTADQTKAYLARVDQLGAELAKLGDDDWFASLSASWVHVLSRLTGTYGKGYPLYMQSPEYGPRQLGAFAGSYAELRHDTLLYAKPNYAEAGDGGEDSQPPPVPRGLVEPNLKFWNELERLATYFHEGLTAHAILPGEQEEFSLTTRFAQLVKFYSGLAAEQLAGKKPSDEDLEKLRATELTDFAKPWGDVLYDEDQQRSGIIADIHTDVPNNRVLYEATAQPEFMLALISADGAPRLAVGVVYAAVEFTAPAGQRLSDQDWRKRVYTDKPDLPANRLPRPGPKQ